MRRWLLLTTALFAVFASCAAETEEFVDRATLLKEPAVQVRFPGAVELAHVGAERVTTFEGPQSAFDGYILGTDAEAEVVHSFYARELGRLGWIPESTTRRSTAELAAWWWCKSGITYRLAIKDQKSAFQPEFYRGQTFRTVFDASLVSRGRSVPCTNDPR